MTPDLLILEPSRRQAPIAPILEAMHGAIVNHIRHASQQPAMADALEHNAAMALDATKSLLEGAKAIPEEQKVQLTKAVLFYAQKNPLTGSKQEFAEQTVQTLTDATQAFTEELKGIIHPKIMSNVPRDGLPNFMGEALESPELKPILDQIIVSMLTGNKQPPEKLKDSFIDAAADYAVNAHVSDPLKFANDAVEAITSATAKVIGELNVGLKKSAPNIRRLKEAVLGGGDEKDDNNAYKAGLRSHIASYAVMEVIASMLPGFNRPYKEAKEYFIETMKDYAIEKGYPSQGDFAEKAYNSLVSLTESWIQSNPAEALLAGMALARHPAKGPSI